MSSAVCRRPYTVVRSDAAAVVVLARDDVELASWPLIVSGHMDLNAVSELARLHIVARRLGCSIQLRDPCIGLLEIVELVGLADVVRAIRRCPWDSL